MLTLDDYWNIVSDKPLLYYYNANNIYFKQMFDNYCQAKAIIDKKMTDSNYSVVGSALYHLVNLYLRKHEDIEAADLRLMAEWAVEEYSPDEGGVQQVITVEFSMKNRESEFKGVNGLNPVISRHGTSQFPKTPTKKLH